MWRCPVSIGEDSHSFYTHFTTRPDDADSDFPPVCDKNFLHFRNKIRSLIYFGKSYILSPVHRLLDKTRVQLIIWWFRLTRKLCVAEELAAIRKGGSGVSSVLIILPEGRENSRVARYFLKSVYHNGGVDLDFLMDKSLYHSFSNALPERVHIYTDEDIDWFHLPKKSFVERVLSQPYHAVVDMHTSFNLSTAYLTYLSKAPVRIGFCSSFAEHFFNVQIDRKDSQFVERGYLAIQKFLDL